jgi:hypothetical protein
MKLMSITIGYEFTGNRKNLVAALRRRGFSVQREQRHPASQPEYLICANRPREEGGAIINLVGRITLSETFPLQKRLEIYGPSDEFDRVKSFADSYQKKR